MIVTTRDYTGSAGIKWGMATCPKKPRDTSQLAKLIVDLSTGEAQDTDPNAGKNPAAIEIARGRYHERHRGHRPDRRHRIAACDAGTKRLIPRTRGAERLY